MNISYKKFLDNHRYFIFWDNFDNLWWIFEILHERISYSTLLQIFYITVKFWILKIHKICRFEKYVWGYRFDHPHNSLMKIKAKKNVTISSVQDCSVLSDIARHDKKAKLLAQLKNSDFENVHVNYFVSYSEFFLTYFLYQRGSFRNILHFWKNCLVIEIFLKELR